MGTMTQNQAEFFRKKILPIIRETAEDRELFFGTRMDRNPLRPMLRQLLGYVDYQEKHQTESRLREEGESGKKPQVASLTGNDSKQESKEIT
jgi:hypothetical protein